MFITHEGLYRIISLGISSIDSETILYEIVTYYTYIIIVVSWDKPMEDKRAWKLLFLLFLSLLRRVETRTNLVNIC